MSEEVKGYLPCFIKTSRELLLSPVVIIVLCDVHKYLVLVVKEVDEFELVRDMMLGFTEKGSSGRLGEAHRLSLGMSLGSSVQWCEDSLSGFVAEVVGFISQPVRL